MTDILEDTPAQAGEEQPAAQEQAGATDYMKIGDGLRDRGNWSAAADAYKQHLEANPQDFDRWLQLGNCLNEIGDFESSLEAYDKAGEIHPTNVDVFILRGHAYRRWGKFRPAMKNYMAVLELDSSNPDARREIAALGGRLPLSTGLISKSNADPNGRTLYLDINDFFFYLRHHMNVSGIQRVIANITEEIIDSDRKTIPSNVTLIVTTGEPLSTLEISPIDVMKVILLTRKSTTTRSDLNTAIQDCYTNAKKAQMRPGDVYVVLGAFWVSSYYERLLIDLREKGVLVGVYVYDLIPITNRNFTVEDLWRNFSRRMAEVMSLSDFAMGISEFVAEEVRRYASETLQLDIPVRAVPLAHQLEDLGADDSELTDVVRDISADPFVLCVGTIEIRKNHQYLVNLWRELVAKHGEDAPNLVLVGRWGWMIDGLKQQLEATNYLDGKVIVIDHVNDAELSHLYRSCMFTIFPSFIEGWGLPVGESLAYGKPCIASGTTSIPEVGGDFVRYLDPHDLASGRRELARVLDDPKDLADWTKHIREDFKPTKWIDVAAKLCRDSEELATQAADARRRAYYKLTPGKIVELGEDARNREIKSDSRSATAALLRIEGWHPSEPWGCWTKLRKSVLRFTVDAPKGTRLRVAMHFRTPMASANAGLTVRSGSVSTNLFLRNPAPRWQYVDAEVEEGGVVELALRCTGEFPVPPNDKRSLFVGLSALGCYATDDIEQRMDLLQSIILT